MKKILSVLLVFVFACLMMSGCQQTDTNSTVATVGSQVITSGEMKYAIGVVKNSMTAGMDEQALQDFWNTLIDGVDPEDYIRENAIDLLVDMTILAEHAKQSGITVTDDDINEYFTQNQDTLAGLMEQYDVDEATLKAIYKKQMLYNDYAQTVLVDDPKFNPSEEELQEYFLRHFCKAQHILKLTVDQATNTPYTQAEKDAVRAEMDGILQALRNGADFEDMMLENTEDPGVEQYPEGYVFAEGEMVPEFYEGTIALSENGISEVIESSYGYHIIKRLPLNIETDFMPNLSKVQSVYVHEIEEQLIEELKTSIEVSLDDAKIKAISIK